MIRFILSLIFRGQTPETQTFDWFITCSAYNPGGEA
jgi:hypothetical protein